MGDSRLFHTFLQSFRLSPQGQPGYFACVADLLEREQLRSLAQFEQHFEINRLQHILCVSYMSYRIALRIGADARLTARAGVLHDLYYYDWRVKDPSHRLHGIYHPGFSLKNTRELLGPVDKRTADAILRHMWPLTPIPPRYKEGLAVTLADKYCAFYECVISFNKKFHDRFYARLEREFSQPEGIALLALQNPQHQNTAVLYQAGGES